MEIPRSVYDKLINCESCSKRFSTLFEYGFHVSIYHRNINISTVKEFKKFVETKILDKLQTIDYYNQLSIDNKAKLFKSVKNKLKEETSFPLTLILPDGIKRRKSKRRKSKSKSRKKSKKGYNSKR